LGVIRWEGEDSTQAAIAYAQIFGKIADTTDGQEGGHLGFQIASHDGEMTVGLELVDGDAEDEIDVNIGSGSASLTSISGDLTVSRDLTVGGHSVNDIDVAGEFVDSDEHLMTSAAINDRFAPISTTFLQVYSQGFFDDIATTKHYLPFKDINEQTTLYQEEAAFLMPFDGRVKSVSLKTTSLTADGNFTVGINTIPTGSNVFSGSNWTEQENEVLAATSTDDNHTFHFVFDNAKHFDAGDSCTISLQASADITGNGYWHVTTVVEFDTANDLGSSSTEHDSTP